jgi:hypothetical protein
LANVADVNAAVAAAQKAFPAWADTPPLRRAPSPRPFAQFFAIMAIDPNAGNFWNGAGVRDRNGPACGPGADGKLIAKATGTAMPAPTASSSFPFQRSSSTMDDAPELGKCFKKPRSNTDPFPQSYARATSVDATSATTFEQPSTETSAIGSDYGTNSNDLNVDQAFDWRGANSMMDLDMDLIMGMAGVVDSKVAVV